MKTKLTLYVLVSLSILSCKKIDKMEPELELPAQTHEGKNTFGCRINGKVWIPETKQDAHPSIPRIQSLYYPDKNTYRIVASFDIPGDLEEISISFKPLLSQPNPYLLKKPYEQSYASYSICSKSDSKCYKSITLDETGGNASITFIDTVKKIVSGTFSYTATDTVRNTSVNVTDGRFDLHY